MEELEKETFKNKNQNLEVLGKFIIYFCSV